MQHLFCLFLPWLLPSVEPFFEVIEYDVGVKHSDSLVSDKRLGYEFDYCLAVLDCT